MEGVGGGEDVEKIKNVVTFSFLTFILKYLDFILNRLYWYMFKSQKVFS